MARVAMRAADQELPFASEASQTSRRERQLVRVLAQGLPSTERRVFAQRFAGEAVRSYWRKLEVRAGVVMPLADPLAMGEIDALHRRGLATNTFAWCLTEPDGLMVRAETSAERPIKLGDFLV